MKNVVSKIQLVNPFNSNVFLIAISTLKHLIRNKRFYIVLFYFLLPVLGSIIEIIVTTEPLKTGKAQAVYHIHSSLYNAFSVWWLSIFGQLFIILLTSDLIASEFEKGTIIALKSSPVSDAEIFIGKILGSVFTLLLMLLPSGIIIYCTQIGIYAPKDFWWVFWHSLDELIVSILVVFLGILLILGVAFLFSSLFNRSLQAILISLLVVFSVQLMSLIFSFASNFFVKINIIYYLNRLLEPVFYNIRLSPAAEASSIGVLLAGFGGIIIALFLGSYLLFKRKEVN